MIRDPLIADALAEMRRHPGRTAAEAAVLALVLLVMVAALCGLALVGWGAMA